jgi:Uma2 family endonuclease
MSAVFTAQAKSIEVTPVEFQEMPADRRVRFTVEQYEQLMRAGFLIEGSPIELLDGQLYWKDRRDQGSPTMTIGRKHVLTVAFLYNWLVEACKEHNCFPLSQQPLRLTSADAPEPDGSVIRGALHDYVEQEIEPDDVLVVVEVADSSLDRDLGDKYQLCAQVGIPTYWIIHLADDSVEVCEVPDTAAREYRQRTVFHKGESVSLALADGTIVTTPLEALLP